VFSLFYLKRKSPSPREIQQVIHHRLDEWNAFFASNRLRFSLRIAAVEGTVGAGGGFGIAKYAASMSNPFSKSSFSMEPATGRTPTTAGYRRD
jgi:hypothetical protein